MFQYHCKGLYLSNWRNVLTGDVIFCTCAFYIHFLLSSVEFLVTVARDILVLAHQSWRAPAVLLNKGAKEIKEIASVRSDPPTQPVQNEKLFCWSHPSTRQF